ncbi:hypothetical protein HNY73_017082 [Argiope bruennichi]|uniref:Uncharacterized protein n=1 Tax=Argiope bruennichi TaxID=94029 RepID=A0A8T0EM94_ARGBR|nr:hypothetical protein HNY73_017082 [Argiope bruennichi]
MFKNAIHQIPPLTSRGAKVLLGAYIALIPNASGDQWAQRELFRPKYHYDCSWSLLGDIRGENKPFAREICDPRGWAGLKFCGNFFCDEHRQMKKLRLRHVKEKGQCVVDLNEVDPGSLLKQRADI